MISYIVKSLVLLALLAAPVAQAHPSVPCRLELTIGTDTVDAEMWLPTDDLTIALAKEWDEPGLEEVSAAHLDETFNQRFKDYIQTYFAMKDGSGLSYEQVIGKPHWQKMTEGSYVVVPIVLQAPQNSDKVLVVYDNVVTEEVVNQKTLLMIKRDFGQALFEPKIHTVLRRWKNEATIDRSEASLWQGSAAMLEHGARHIAEGLDHLLFLLVLLMVAPLTSSATHPLQRQWDGRKSSRQAATGLLAIITAFTIGHSITLALGVLGWVSISSTIIEVLVGVSIAIGAVNLVRPIFAKNEAPIAALFGLVHGLAFATTLSDYHLQGSSLAVALASFNLGVELGQLAIIAVIGPLVLVMAKHSGYRYIANVTAVLALVAASAWILERLGVPNLIASSLEDAAQQPELSLGTVALVFIVVVLIQQLWQWQRSKVRYG